MSNFGETKLGGMCLGDTEIAKAYLGDTLVFQKTSPVPPPYDAEVEYLQSSGTQYILTDIKPKAGYTFDTKVAATSSGNVVYWGARQSGTYSSNNNQCYLNSNSSSTNARTKRINLYSTSTSNNNNWDSGITPALNTMYTLTGATVVSSMVSFTYAISLFALNNIGTIGFAGTCRIGAFKAYDNGVLIADFISVRVGQVGYMYDKVSKTLFGNDGTGDFALGPDVT